ncbi:alpha/beta-hydrolase [Mycena pura]|uniref:Alpha/beta-hydrolase n=1 Tax=Mycena pura TaxID=153505 RepID=A0AAD6VDQ5_9AGAR|nr:alpha/beta-hydrolase [Mycena pura]
MAAFEKTIIKLPSAHPDWNLDVWQYLPTAPPAARLPVIVMAHGFGADKTMGLAPYAEAFAGAGYASLVFDYRRWGTSDGTPRHMLIVRDQLDDYRTVIEYARQQLQFDPQRVPSVNAVAALAQCPYTGTIPSQRLGATYFKIVAAAALDTAKQAMGLAPEYIPTVAEPGAVGALTTEGTVAGMLAIVAQDSPWNNKIAASSLLQVGPYNPRAKAAQIACPLLIVLPVEDNLTPPAGAWEIAKAVPEKCELVELQCGHFAVYPGLAHHRESLAAQMAFLAKHVPI